MLSSFIVEHEKVGKCIGLAFFIVLPFPPYQAPFENAWDSSHQCRHILVAMQPLRNMIQEWQCVEKSIL